MYPNPYVAQQLAKDKEAELRQYWYPSVTGPRPRKAGWMVGLFALVLTGAGFFIR